MRLSNPENLAVPETLGQKTHRERSCPAANGVLRVNTHLLRIFDCLHRESISRRRFFRVHKHSNPASAARRYFVHVIARPVHCSPGARNMRHAPIPSKNLLAIKRFR